MSPSAEHRAESLFYEALELPSSERDGFLNEACAQDVDLRAEVEELLGAHDGAASFLHVDAPPLVDLEPGGARLKPEQVGERMGNYKLLEQIGEGGFGTVWVAEQERPMRRRVALKIIKLGMDTKEVIARFEQERQALAMMDHPNIAKVLDAGATPTGRPYFVMELVRGVKITEYCDQTNLPTAERLRLFIAVCHAVQHAHQKGIIHRDLKPSNILVTLHDGVPVPKVIDFGVAKATQQQRLTDLTVYTQFEQMVGTPLYMSPEQAEMSGLDIDTRSDIYSLGVLLYELLVGRTPFDPEALMKRGLDEIRRAVRDQEPQRPSTFVSTMALDLRTNLAQRRQTDSTKLIGQIRGDLDWIVMKALEKDRARRYETASSLAQDIQRHLGSEPVQARPPTHLYRFRRFANRNKVAFAAGAAVAAALLAGVAVSTWQAVRANVALSELRTSAPAFAAMARDLVVNERFDEAIEKLDVAIRLQPDVAEYLLAKADLLEAQLRFAQAAPVYRAALRLRPEDSRAQANTELCETLALEAAAQPTLCSESLALLFALMNKESRPAAELMRVGRLLGEEKKVLLDYWTERLKDLPTPSEHPLQTLLAVGDTGRLHLDLRSTYVSDLTPLRGMPLESLYLSGCADVADLSPLTGMPLEALYLGREDAPDDGTFPPLSKIRDLSALRGLRLKILNVEEMRVTDLAPLAGMPLECLNLKETPVHDLGPLCGMPLKELHIAGTQVTDLAPLRGMPLRILNCNSIPALDFSVLADAPLEVLALHSTAVGDLSFLRKMPLKKLLLSSCEEARGFKVLSEIPTLEILTLPGLLSKTFPTEELTAVEALRSHPHLQQIRLGRGSTGDSVSQKEVFWKEFDEDLQTRRALAQVSGGKSVLDKLPDGTWFASFQDQPVRDISPLEGTRISVLVLTGTQIASASALRTLPLKRLSLGKTKVTDLEPLKDLHLLDLFLHECQSGIDLSPLGGMTTLEKIALPPNPRNLEVIRKLPHVKFLSFDVSYQPGGVRVSQTAEDFWRDLPAEELARAGKFAEAESLLRSWTGPSASVDWGGLGAVMLAQGDDCFEALCREMLASLKGAHPAETARICLLSPNPYMAGAEPEAAIEQLRSAHPSDAYYNMIKAFYAFRTGRYEETVGLLTSFSTGNYFPAWSAEAGAMLAMAYHREGNSEAANTTLAQTRAVISANWPHRRSIGRWQDWLSAKLLLEEAEELLAGQTLPPSRVNEPK